MYKNKYRFFRNFDFLFIDLLAMLISFTLAFFLKFHGLWFFSGPDWNNLVWARLILLIYSLDFFFTFLTAPYYDIFNRPYYMEVFRALKLGAQNMISVALIVYIFKIGEDYSRTVFILTYCFYLVLSFIMKYIWKQIVLSGKIGILRSQQTPLFVVADRSNAEETLMNITAGDINPYDIKGIYLGDDGEGEFKNIPVIGNDYADFIVSSNIRDVVIAASSVDARVMKKLVDNGVSVHLSIESIVGIQTEDQYLEDVGICRTMSVGAFTFSLGQLFYLRIKRLLDLVVGLAGTVFLLPISLFIKAAYLISGDKAPIFYSQKRVGLNGKPIRIYKYRTMVTDAEKVLKELLKKEEYRKEWEANQKLRNDPRITKVGRVLRKLSIDEFPQMLNLINGTMSLVGPRPLAEGELEAHDGLKLYQRFKPGITGWWGCNGRSNIEYRERLELEYYYIKHFSFYLDMLCVVRSVYAVLKKDGAG